MSRVQCVQQALDVIIMQGCGTDDFHLQTVTSCTRARACPRPQTCPAETVAVTPGGNLTLLDKYGYVYDAEPANKVRYSTALHGGMRWLCGAGTREH